MDLKGYLFSFLERIFEQDQIQQMIKILFSLLLLIFTGSSVIAQPPTREDLERQRLELKKEIEQTEKLLNENKHKTKENQTQLALINNKVNLQDRVIDNINRDIDLLDNNIFGIQRDINRYDRLLDTLKKEYAKSMVYAYKNRGNYDFLNFIFSAASFNDAIKRIAYLKSYRNYREMQGQNILRTQELRRQRIETLGGVKEKKNIVLETKDREMVALESQQKEKDRIVAELKKQGKQFNNQIAAKKKQMGKVDKAIAAAIKRAMDDARKAALLVKEKNVTPKIPKKPGIIRKEPDVSFPLNPENVVLNEKFISNKGSLPWPVDKGNVSMHYGRNQLISGTYIDITGITVATAIGSPVKAIFDGLVSKVLTIDEMQVVIIQHGKYFSTYSNLEKVTVQTGQNVKTGQVIGKAAANLDGVGAVDFYINDERNNLDPERWLRTR